MVYQRISILPENCVDTDAFKTAIGYFSVLTPIILNAKLSTEKDEATTTAIKQAILHRYLYALEGLSLGNDFKYAFEFLDYGLPVMFFNFEEEMQLFQEVNDQNVHNITAIKESLFGIPRVRLGLNLTFINEASLSNILCVIAHLRDIIGHFSVSCLSIDHTLIINLLKNLKSISANGPSIEIYINFPEELAYANTKDTQLSVASTSEHIHLVLPSKFRVSEEESRESQLLETHSKALSIPFEVVPNIQELDTEHFHDVLSVYLATIKSDRPDQLITTVICDENSVCLGLVYSNHTSIRLSFINQRGIFYSRSRQSIWRKGETSNMHQILQSMRLDCDRDALKFTVIQCGDVLGAGACFCHLYRRSCFEGEDINHNFNYDGFGHLQRTLEGRRQELTNAQAGIGGIVANSYTHRLFQNDDLLRQKLLEEAQELMEAETHEDIASEAADVFYFMLTRCVQKGVQLHDIQRYLIQRSYKLARRPGHAKEWRTIAAEKTLAKQEDNDESQV